MTAVGDDLSAGEIETDDIADPWQRVCPRCGRPFSATHLDQRYCSDPTCQRDKIQKAKTNHAARSRRRFSNERHFVAIDGEGISGYDETGKVISHDYVLLGATGCEPLHKNGERLTTTEIFHYLYYDVFQPISKQRPDAVYIGFALGYDWGQWVRDLPKSRSTKLLSPRNQL